MPVFGACRFPRASKAVSPRVCGVCHCILCWNMSDTHAVAMARIWQKQEDPASQNMDASRPGRLLRSESCAPARFAACALCSQNPATCTPQFEEASNALKGLNWRQKAGEGKSISFRRSRDKRHQRHSPQAEALGHCCAMLAVDGTSPSQP